MKTKLDLAEWLMWTTLVYVIIVAVFGLEVLNVY